MNKLWKPEVPQSLTIEDHLIQLFLFDFRANNLKSSRRAWTRSTPTWSSPSRPCDRWICFAEFSRSFGRRAEGSRKTTQFGEIKRWDKTRPGVRIGVEGWIWRRVQHKLNAVQKVKGQISSKNSGKSFKSSIKVKFVINTIIYKNLNSTSDSFINEFVINYSEW